MELGLSKMLRQFGEALFARLNSTKAIDLTDEEAFNLMMYLAVTGEIELADPIKLDAAGNYISHKPGQQTRLRTAMAGVEYYRAALPNKGINGSAGAVKMPHFEPNPRFAIVLHRLAVRLAQNWGATRIIYGGIGKGSGENALDCHMNGTCCDLYGAITAKGVFDVRRDWFYRTVYDAAGAKRKGGGWDRWGDATETYYRLAASPDQSDCLPRDFFLDVYTFISEQCMFGSNDISPASFRSLGAIRHGYTLHPDYPNVRKRQGHNDHIHFQTGPAFLTPKS